MPILLWPLSIVYSFVVYLRNLLFDIGVFKQTGFSVPVISVGNLSAGGTGKTPVVAHIVSKFMGDNRKVAIVSRGYKGNYERDGSKVLCDIENAAGIYGDEPVWFSKTLNTPVYVGRKRVAAVRAALDENPDVIVADDAFQHRKVKGSFYILLTKYNDIFTDDFLLPTGNLRESRAGANRADVIIVTKCPRNLKDSDKKIIERKLKKYNKKIFFSTISYASKISGSKQILIEEVVDFEESIEIIEPAANHQVEIKDLNIENIHAVWKVHLEKEILGISSKNTSKTPDLALLVLQKFECTFKLTILLIELKSFLDEKY